MDVTDALLHTFDEVHRSLHQTVRGLDADALAWRPGPEANPIGWLVWHLTRVEDDHVGEIAGRDQVWAGDGWAERFGLAAGSTDTGFGHTPEQVGAVRVDGPQVLLDYSGLVARNTREYLERRAADDLDRVIDRSFDPPVTVGVRLLSVIGDAFQHLGQAAYVRGLLDRRA